MIRENPKNLKYRRGVIDGREVKMLRLRKLSILSSFILLLLIVENANLANGENTITNAANNATNVAAVQQQASLVIANGSTTTTGSQESKIRKVSKTDHIPGDNIESRNESKISKEGPQILAEGVAISTPEVNKNNGQKEASKAIESSKENQGASPQADAKNSSATASEGNKNTTAAAATTTTTTAAAKPISPNNATQSTITVPKTNSTAATIPANSTANGTPTKAAAISSTTTTTTTSSTTTTTSTTKAPPPPPTKPHVTGGLADLPESEVANANKPEPEVAPDRESIMRPPYHRNRDYIVPIVTVMLTVPLAMAAFIVVYRRFRDYWSTRHYRRMDFLLDGMYND